MCSSSVALLVASSDVLPGSHKQLSLGKKFKLGQSCQVPRASASAQIVFVGDNVYTDSHDARRKMNILEAYSKEVQGMFVCRNID